MLRAWSSHYSRLLTRFPVSVQVVTSAAIWGGGDLLVQRLEHVGHSTDEEHSGAAKFELDSRRLVSMAGFGGAFLGTAGHFWYVGLDSWAAKRFPRKVQFVAAKVAMDALLFGPIYLACFFAATGVMEARSLQQIDSKFRNDFVPTFVAQSSFWPAMQAVNFALVPLRHQLLFVNTCSVLDAAFLSWSGHQENWFEKLRDLWKDKGEGSEQDDVGS